MDQNSASSNAAAPLTGSGKAAEAYQRLVTDREPFLFRARECARLTIPSLLPPEGSTGSTQFETPWQSIGSRGVNNLASKLLLTLLPPNVPFFKLFASEKVKSQVGPDQLAKLDEGLGAAERITLQRIEANQIRITSFQALKHLIVTGNSCMYFGKKASRMFPLSQYVCRRNPADGKPLEIVIKELIAPEEVPAQIKDQVLLKSKPEEKRVEVYTHCQLDGSKWTVRQEIKGVTVPDSEGTYTEDNFPYRVLRWTKVDGEDYGRGLSEEVIGDLRLVDRSTESISEYGAAAARIQPLVNPGGQTDLEDLKTAQNGEYRYGKAEDVTLVQLQKSQDFAIVKAILDDAKTRLNYAFLLNSAIQRDAERVTAEEIRYMAQELEDALGGVYSLLSIEFQLPIVKIVMGILARENELPSLPENLVTPTVVTGIDALGRNHEMARLNTLLQTAEAVFGPGVAQYFVIPAVLSKMATSLGVDTTGLIKTQEQIQAEQQQANAQQLLQKGVGPAINAVSAAQQAQAQSPGQPQPQTP